MGGEAPAGGFRDPAGGKGKLLAHEQQLANVDTLGPSCKLGACFVVFWFCLWRDVLGEVVVHALEDSFHCAIGVREGEGKEPVGGDVAVDSFQTVWWISGKPIWPSRYMSLLEGSFIGMRVPIVLKL